MKTTDQNKGFTLLEILISLVIITVIFAIAMPTFGQREDKLAKQETLRLLAAIEMVKDKAVLEDNEYGLHIDNEGYEFLILDDTEEDRPPAWKRIEDVKALQRHEFPKELVMVNLAIDGENLFKAKEDEVEIFEEDINIFEDEDEQPKIEPPELYFLSTGEQNEFTIAIAPVSPENPANPDTRFYRLQGKYSGKLKLKGPLEGNLMIDINREYNEDN